MKKIFLLIIVNICAFTAFAQREIELNNRYGFKDYVFDNHIGSLLAYKTGSEMSEPFIEFNSSETITFSFDDLAENARDLYYTITHCDADWHEDNLFVGDYMKGFVENNFFDFQTSSNTYVVYRNYQLEIPNKDVRIVTSGNFLLKVYDRDDNEKPLFQKGFRIFERRASASVQYRSLMNGFESESQQLDFAVNRGTLAWQNPQRELKVRVEQNSQRMPAAALPVIAFQNSMQADYTNATKNIYKGENEFRTFDTRNLSYNAKGVNKILTQNRQWHVLLNIDVPAGQTYEYVRDINGKYYVEADRIDKSTDKNTEADYVNVYFTIDASNVPHDLDVYVYGALSNWGLSPKFKMEYNPERQTYEATIALKQGYYNYKYVGVDAKGNFLSDFFDGSFAQTENEYLVYAYFRGMNDRWDKLVAIGGASSVK